MISKRYRFAIAKFLEYEKNVLEPKISTLSVEDLNAVSGGVGPKISAFCLSTLMGISAIGGASSNLVSAQEINLMQNQISQTESNFLNRPTFEQESFIGTNAWFIPFQGEAGEENVAQQHVDTVDTINVEKIQSKNESALNLEDELLEIDPNKMHINEDNELEDKIKERFLNQQELLKSAMTDKSPDDIQKIKTSKTFADVQKVSDRGFVLTESSFNEIKQNFNNKDFNSGIVKIDLFDANNLSIALEKGLEFVLFDKTDSNFVVSSVDAWSLQDSPQLKKEVEYLYNYIKNNIDSKEDKQIHILRELNEINKAIKDDKKVQKGEYFSLFVDGMRQAYQVCIARRVADKALQAGRDASEKELGSREVSRSAEVSAKANIEGVAVGVGCKANSGEGATETSFYTINVGGGISASVGADLCGTVSAKVGVSSDVQYSEIFYSLEQFLDSKLPSSAAITSFNIAKSEITRKQMQNRERELLSVFKVSIEGYLNATGVVPISVPIEWPSITRVSSKQSKTTVNSKLEVAMDALAALNMSVSGGIESAVNTYARPYLELIEDDCSPAAGLTSKNIVSFLKANKSKIYNIMTEELNARQTKEERQAVLPILVTNVLGDIREYNAVLAILSNKMATTQEKKMARERKHGIEDRWSSSLKISKHKGRTRVLRSMLGVATTLRDIAESDRDIELFKQLYIEIDRLSKYQEFSKSRSARNSSFSTNYMTASTTANGKLAVTVPNVGQGSINVNYCQSLGPVYYDNSTDITLQVKLPTVSNGVTGIETITSLLQTLAKKSDKDLDLGDAFLLTNSSLHDYIATQGVMSPLSTAGYFTLTVVATHIDKSDESQTLQMLPGSDEIITKNSGKWVIKYIKTMFSTQAGVKFLIPGVADINVSDSLGRVKLTMGSNTLSFVSNKYNALKLGFKDQSALSKGKNSVWESFKKNQKDKLLELLQNISDKQSNVRYELQAIYSDILNKDIKSMSANKKVEQHKNTFNELLKSCDELAGNKTNITIYEKALDCFEQVLELDYTQRFLPAFNQVYSI